MKFKTRELTLIGTMAAVTAVVAIAFRFYPVALGTVPFSLLPFMAVLAGGILGGRLGAWSMVTYLLMGLVGFQVFATEPYGGPLYLLKPTFGFLLGYIPAAYISGHIIWKNKEASVVVYIMAMMLGITSIYLVGIPYLYVMTKVYLGQTITLGIILGSMSILMILDLVKAVGAALVAHAVLKRLK
ncbi:biotin transporter BioY [Peptococcaceae bacterium 1198_IL3148]